MIILDILGISAPRNIKMSKPHQAGRELSVWPYRERGDHLSQGHSSGGQR